MSLPEAVKNKNKDEVDRLLRSGTNVNQKDTVKNININIQIN